MPYAFQRVLAAFALILVAPFLGVLAIMVRLDSRGPGIFRGERVGLHGSVFLIHKLRTMRWQPDAPRADLTSGSDPRVTSFGRLLRRTRLDELPQLWDVCRGRMALVGPRPEAPAYVDLADPRWREILSLRPGITGPTQLEFRDEGRLLRGSNDDRVYRDELLPRKIASDLDYVRSRTWRGDLRLIFMTLLPPGSLRAS